MYINGVLFEATLQDILDELVRQLRINDIPYLQKMKESGGDIMVTCPYHNNGMERRPSAGIKKSDGTFHCLACHETHSLQEVIAYCFGYPNDMLGAFGWKWLKTNFLTISVEERDNVVLDLERNKTYREYRNISGGADTSNIINNAIYYNSTDIGSYVSEEELDSYRYYHPYMKKRGFTDEIIEIYDIGYDVNAKSLTFPCKDINGHCLFIARRSVNSKWFNIPQGVQKPLYGIYECNKYSLSFPSELVVCEGMIDAITVHVHDNTKWGISLFGLGNTLQFEQLRKLPCRKLILATDADDAGMKARERIKKNVPNKIITQYIWDKSMAKDINDMTKEQFLNLEEAF